MLRIISARAPVRAGSTCAQPPRSSYTKLVHTTWSSYVTILSTKLQATNDDIRAYESPLRGGFIPAETLVHNGTVGDNDRRNLEPASTMFSGRMKPGGGALGGIWCGNVARARAAHRAGED